MPTGFEISKRRPRQKQKLISVRCHFKAVYRFLTNDEAVEVVRGYERRNRFMRWIVRLVLSRLLGWNYRGSDSDHQRLVEQLPLIAFQPRQE